MHNSQECYEIGSKVVDMFGNITLKQMRSLALCLAGKDREDGPCVSLLGASVIADTAQLDDIDPFIRLRILSLGRTTRARTSSPTLDTASAPSM